MPELTSIGAVIVTHNSVREIGRCLDSLPPGIGTVVVDNASSDGTCGEVARHSDVSLIANPWNRGFAAAANQGIGALGSDLVLLMNPDIEWIGGLDALAAACCQPGAGAAAPQLIGEDGAPQQGFMVRRFPTPAALAFEALGINRLWSSNPVNRRYRCFDLDPKLAARVEQPAGALLMIRRAAWQEVGGLDETYFPVWFEDVDFLERLASRGHSILYVPSAMAKHKGGHSVKQVATRDRELFWYGNLLLYGARHFSRSSRLAVCSAVMLGSIFRTIRGVFHPASPKSVTVYASVFRRAMVCAVSPPVEAPVIWSALDLL